MRDFLGMESGPGTDWSYERLMDDNTRLRSVNAVLVEALKAARLHAPLIKLAPERRHVIATLDAAIAAAAGNVQKTEG